MFALLVASSLCDVVWRLFRPLVVGCDKPRLPPWHEKTSGGNPIDFFPSWSKDGEKEVVTLYQLAAFLDAVEAFRRGQRTDVPDLATFAASDVVA